MSRTLQACKGGYILDSEKFPWQGGPKVLSLGYMIHALMPEILNIAHALAWCRVNTVLGATTPLTDVVKGQLKSEINYVLSATTVLGLSSAEKKARRILEQVDTQPADELFREIV